MTAARVKYMPEPRLLDREQAARYCGISPDMFERSCPVEARRFGTGKNAPKRWDRVEIDSWLDAKPTTPQSTSPILDRFLRGENANAR